MIATWTLGLLRRRRGRLAATAAGIAAAVALLACLGSFLAAAQGSMTARAIRSVTVDWQVEVQPDTQPSTVLDTVRSAPNVQAALPVGYAHSTGFVAQTGGSTQTTGPAMVLGIPPNYREQFPGAIRTLVGADNGVLIAQQTAANLHAAPGDTIHVGRAGIAPVDVVVDGVVDLPQADSLFQKVGAPVGAQPAAPPDNVLILGQAQWQQRVRPAGRAAARPGQHPDPHRPRPHAAARPGLGLHRKSAPRRTTWKPAPPAAHASVTTSAPPSDAARSDAAYAQVLFLFLGLPGAVLAALLTATVVTAGADRRRQDQALLRARGASPIATDSPGRGRGTRRRTIGSAVGLGRRLPGRPGRIRIAQPRCRPRLPPSGGRPPQPPPDWRSRPQRCSHRRGVTCAAPPSPQPAPTVRRTRPPRWTRFGLDVAVLAACRHAVLAGRARRLPDRARARRRPDDLGVLLGVRRPGPAVDRRRRCWRGGWPTCSSAAAGRSSRRALRPLAGGRCPSDRRAFAVTAAARRWPARSCCLALALAFARPPRRSTPPTRPRPKSTRNSPTVPTSPSPNLRAAPCRPDAAHAHRRSTGSPCGRTAPAPFRLHRRRPAGPLRRATRPPSPRSPRCRTPTSQGGTAHAADGRSSPRGPDSMLVSAETVKDFQLLPGDPLNLRLPGRAHRPADHCPFHYVGVVTEFPTAPKDSFFVANAGYVAATHRQRRRRGFPGRHRRPRHHRSRRPDPNRGRDRRRRSPTSPPPAAPSDRA